MLTKVNLNDINKDVRAAISSVLAKYEQVTRGVVILEVQTLREASGDKNSYEYTFKVRAQVVKSTEEETPE